MEQQIAQLETLMTGLFEKIEDRLVVRILINAHASFVSRILIF